MLKSLSLSLSLSVCVCVWYCIAMNTDMCLRMPCTHDISRCEPEWVVVQHGAHVIRWRFGAHFDKRVFPSTWRITGTIDTPVQLAVQTNDAHHIESYSRACPLTSSYRYRIVCAYSCVRNAFPPRIVLMQTKGRWLRIWVDIGSADSIAFDMLVNALRGYHEKVWR